MYASIVRVRSYLAPLAIWKGSSKAKSSARKLDVLYWWTGRFASAYDLLRSNDDNNQISLAFSIDSAQITIRSTIYRIYKLYARHCEPRVG